MKIDEPRLKVMLSMGAVKQVDVVSRDGGFTVLITGNSNNACTLSSQRSDKRVWKSMDTLHGYLKSIGVGSYSVI